MLLLSYMLYCYRAASLNSTLPCLKRAENNNLMHRMVILIAATVVDLHLQRLTKRFALDFVTQIISGLFNGVLISMPPKGVYPPLKQCSVSATGKSCHKGKFYVACWSKFPIPAVGIFDRLTCSCQSHVFIASEHSSNLMRPFEASLSIWRYFPVSVTKSFFCSAFDFEFFQLVVSIEF